VSSIAEHLIEEFAREEHDRWVESKLRDGFIRGDTDDDTAKTRTTLVPYDDRSESEKDKDRAPLIDFIETLKTLGKQLYYIEKESI
jgi:hypothetical protein